MLKDASKYMLYKKLKLAIIQYFANVGCRLLNESTEAT